MPSLTLKDVPKALHAKLKRRARLHKRSLTQEAIACLEATIRDCKPVPAEVWERQFQKVRENINVPPLTNAFLDWAVNQGRA